MPAKPRFGVPDKEKITSQKIEEYKSDSSKKQDYFNKLRQKASALEDEVYEPVKDAFKILEITRDIWHDYPNLNYRQTYLIHLEQLYKKANSLIQSNPKNTLKNLITLVNNLYQLEAETKLKTPEVNKKPKQIPEQRKPYAPPAIMEKKPLPDDLVFDKAEEQTFQDNSLKETPDLDSITTKLNNQT